MENTKILFYTDNPIAGGGNKYFVDLINAASYNFVDILIITNNNGFFPDDYARLLKKTNIITVRRIGFNSLKEFLAKLNLERKLFIKIAILISLIMLPLYFVINVIIFIRLLKIHKPNYIVASNGGYPAAESVLAFVVAARINRIPSILTVVSMPAKRRWYLYLYDLFLDKIISKSTKTIIVNSIAQINAFNVLRGFTKSKLVCLYNGLPDIDPSLILNKDIDKQLINIGVVSRLSKGKGHDVLLNAIKKLLMFHNNFALIIIGNGPEYNNLQKLCCDLGINELVEFRGFISDSELNLALADLDFFVFPSLWEGLPYSILEALRVGLPIISTNVGGIPEVVRDRKDGILVNPGSENELVEAMSLLLSDRKLLREMSKNSRARYETNFTLNKMETQAQHLLMHFFKASGI